jgi:hypothetical protein
MKILHPKSTIAIALLLGSALAASAVQVTYKVNMSVQIALGNFHPGTDTVFVSGNFATTDGLTWLQSATDGATNYVLSPSGTNADVYVGTFTITNAAATFENHQFIINPNGDFTGTLLWEPGISGGGNRFFEVPTVATNLPDVYFNDVAPGSAIAANVSFYIDMSIQQTLGNFNPSTDMLLVAGDWNWNLTGAFLLPTGTNANVYTTTVNITNTLNTLVNYKFIILPMVGDAVWEAAVGPGGPSGNRQFAFPGVATNLATVFFNNQTNASITVPVTFQVNLLTMNAIGTFDPSVDSVYVCGQWNWAGNAKLLTQSASDPNTYTGSVTFAGYSPGSSIQYKYTINGGLIWENNNVGPGGAQNRTFPLASAATNLPGDYFNNYTNLGTVTISNGAGYSTIRWPRSGTRIRLQNTTSMDAAWTDVPNTLGSNNVTLPVSGKNFYRVKGP